MHQSMHSGSMARAASALPISAVSQPNCARIPDTAFFATSSLPQMNMVGVPVNCGFTMHAAPTELKAFTKRAPCKLPLQTFHQGFVQIGEVLQYSVHGWGVRDRIGRVDDNFSGKVGSTSSRAGRPAPLCLLPPGRSLRRTSQHHRSCQCGRADSFVPTPQACPACACRSLLS